VATLAPPKGRPAASSKLDPEALQVAVQGLVYQVLEGM
jgi:hypothetical protein